MLKLPNFDHMNITKISFGLHDKILLKLWTEIMLSKRLFKMSVIYQLCIEMYFLSLVPDIMKIAKLW